VKCAQSIVDQQFGYVRLAAPLLDLAEISTEFSGAITTQFCFTYTLEGATVEQQNTKQHRLKIA